MIWRLSRQWGSQDAAARLRGGAAALRRRKELDDAFLREVGALQQAWPVSRAPAGTSGHFRVQLLRHLARQGLPLSGASVPQAEQMPEDIAADCFVDLLQV